MVGLPFPIPLGAPLDGDHVVALGLGYDGEDETGAEHEHCPGKATNPKAAEGYLCVYTGGTTGVNKVEQIFNPSEGYASDLGGGGEDGAAATGAGLHLSGEGYMAGTWAVTAS